MSQGNSFGNIFCITTWGESHGGGVGVVIDGCPPLLKLSEEDIQKELDRRRPGQSKITTQRKELDRAEILSGVFEGKTLGTPISILVHNQDARSSDYQENKHVFRPSHADFTYQKKYGIRNWQGGGRASARETIGRVAAGAVAQKILDRHKIKVIGYVKRIGDIEASISPQMVSASKVEKSLVRCPDAKISEAMIQSIEKIRSEGDSLGGVIELIVRNVPVGIGQPVFLKLEAELGKGILSLPACKGVEFGSGFAGTHMKGSEHNDPFVGGNGKIKTTQNLSGGIQGGISNGADIILRAAFKPTATIQKDQKTVNQKGKNVTFRGRGRHDPCVLPRAVPMVEAMTRLVLADLILMQRAQCGTF